MINKLNAHFSYQGRNSTFKDIYNVFGGLADKIDEIIGQLNLRDNLEQTDPTREAAGFQPSTPEQINPPKPPSLLLDRYRIACALGLPGGTDIDTIIETIVALVKSEADFIRRYNETIEQRNCFLNELAKVLNIKISLIVSIAKENIFTAIRNLQASRATRASTLTDIEIMELIRHKVTYEEILDKLREIFIIKPKGSFSLVSEIWKLLESYEKINPLHRKDDFDSQQETSPGESKEKTGE